MKTPYRTLLLLLLAGFAHADEESNSAEPAAENRETEAEAVPPPSDGFGELE